MLFNKSLPQPRATPKPTTRRAPSSSSREKDFFQTTFSSSSSPPRAPWKVFWFSAEGLVWGAANEADFEFIACLGFSFTERKVASLLTAKPKIFFFSKTDFRVELLLPPRSCRFCLSIGWRNMEKFLRHVSGLEQHEILGVATRRFYGESRKRKVLSHFFLLFRRLLRVTMGLLNLAVVSVLCAGASIA